MKKPLLFAVALWSLVCLGMTCWAAGAAEGHNPRDAEAYITDTAYALPAMPQQQAVRPVYPQATTLPLRPWEADQGYQQELNLLIRESALRQRQYRERAEADLSRLEAQRIENINRHLASMERLGDRKNTSYTEYSTLASRHNSREADYRARASQIKMTLETSQLREQTDLSRRIRSLDDSYARREPWRAMLANR